MNISKYFCTPANQPNQPNVHVLCRIVRFGLIAYWHSPQRDDYLFNSESLAFFGNTHCSYSLTHTGYFRCSFYACFTPFILLIIQRQTERSEIRILFSLSFESKLTCLNCCFSRFRQVALFFFFFFFIICTNSSSDVRAMIFLFLFCFSLNWTTLFVHELFCLFRMWEL